MLREYTASVTSVKPCLYQPPPGTLIVVVDRPAGVKLHVPARSTEAIAALPAVKPSISPAAATDAVDSCCAGCCAAATGGAPIIASKKTPIAAGHLLAKRRGRQEGSLCFIRSPFG